MKLTIFTANCVGNPANTLYPNKAEIENKEDMMAVISRDHVCAEFKNCHRSNDDFISSDAEVMDCDNDHSDDPNDWITAEKYEELFPDVSYILVPSRNDRKVKGKRSARPRHHIYFPHGRITAADEVAGIKTRLKEIAPFFDDNALDAARFIFGHALLQKTITTDFIEKTRIKNDGTVPQYYVKSSQEAIIPRDVFTQVQEEMLRRANMTSGRDGQKRRIYSSRYALSSICTCMKCGDIYRRVVWNNRGKKSTVWRCCTRVEKGPSACSAPTVPEEELQQAVIDAMNAVLESSKDVIAILEENILEVISQDNFDEIEEINKTIAEKQKELLELVHGKKDYSKCADEMEELRQHKQLLLVKHAQTEGTRQRINELATYVKTQDTQITEYDDKLARKYIEQIQIYDDKFVVCFKAKMEINVLR